MGVPGLWDILNHAGKSRAIAHLAVVEGFEKNESGSRTFRLGIDASLWLQHGTFSAGGKSDDRGANPEIRTLFFRLCKLSRLPVSLLFMFDGRGRPSMKRGSRMGKSGSHSLARDFKKLIDIFGMDWREARGEAEAELAYLNQVGAIDAIISDDVDTFVFGAQTVIKNLSLKLTGNKAHPARNANGNPSACHAHIFKADDFTHHPDIQMSRGGLVLFALLSGGDYGKGVHGCGVDKAHTLARLGYGDRLLEAYESRSSAAFRAFLPQWRAEMEAEIRTNAHGHLSRRGPSFTIPDTFPPMDVLEQYVCPLTSATDGHGGGGPPRDRHSIDLPALASFCESHFDEWGHRSKLLARFKSLLTEGLVMTVLKAAVHEVDRREEEHGPHAGHDGAAPMVGTCATLVRRCLVPKRRTTREEDMQRIAPAFVNRGPPGPEVEDRAKHVEDRHPLLVGITRTRQHVSTDKLLEYRVEVCPRQFIDIANSGIKGKHPELQGRGGRGRAEDSDDDVEDDEDDEDEPGRRTKGKKKKALTDNVLLWLPASIIQRADPTLVAEYENTLREKQAKKKRTAVSQDGTGAAEQPQARSSRAKTKGKGRARTGKDLGYDYLAINPFASSAPAKEHIDPFALSTFPQEKHGFLLTWPDPDDPVALVVDTSARDDLPTKVNYANIDGIDGDVFREHGNVAPRPRASATNPTSASKRKGKSRADSNADSGENKRKRGTDQVAASENNEGEEDWSEPEDDGPLSFMNDAIDRILGVHNVHGPLESQRKADTKRGTGTRASASAAGSNAGELVDSGATRQPPAKRRKTTGAGAHGTMGGPAGDARTRTARDVDENRPPQGGTGVASVSQAQARVPSQDVPALNASGRMSLLDLDGLIVMSRSPSPTRSRPSSPVPDPPSRFAAPDLSRSGLSWRAPIPSRILGSPAVGSASASRPSGVPVHRRTTPFDEEDVIELSSDSDDEVPADADRTQRSDYDDGEFWSSMPMFSGKPSAYQLRKAAEATQRASSFSDGPQEDRMDVDHVPEPWKPARLPSCAYRRTLERDSFPCTSQESRLDDDEDFFSGVSAVIRMS